MTTPNEKSLAAVGNIAPQDELRAARHTPTPWRTSRSCATRQLHITTDSTWICGQFENDSTMTVEAQANADLIVRAVNRDHLFDELVRMLTKVRRVLHDDGYARIVLECDAILANAKADRDFLNS